MLNRRGMLSGILAFAGAPAIVKADNIMRVKKVKDPFVLALGNMQHYTWHYAKAFPYCSFSQYPDQHIVHLVLQAQEMRAERPSITTFKRITAFDVHTQVNKA